MKHALRIQTYVLGIALIACAVTYAAWLLPSPFPGFWALSVLITTAILLQVTATDLRTGDAEGSASFIMHLASGILFGAFWAGVVAAASTAISQGIRRRPL